MQELAPRAIGLGLGFAYRGLKSCAEDRLLVVVPFEVRPMLVAPVDAEDFLQRVSGRLTAGTVERRNDGGVFNIAHEIHSLCEAIPTRGSGSNWRAGAARP